MQTLQAAASALFRQLIKPDPVQEVDEQVGPHLAHLLLSVLDGEYGASLVYSSFQLNFAYMG